MADGRMLKKVVSESKRLPKLKTDSARLLWTWILPYLDIEGRCLASPDIIKGKVVPRIKSFDETNIELYLIDMHDVGLITLYEVDGEKYLQFRNFRELQNLRESKEAKSKIPPPPKDSPTPGPIPDPDGNTHLQFNLIKGNLIKANLRDPDEQQIVDNSNHKDAFLKELEEIMVNTTKKYNSPQEQAAIVNFVKSNIRSGNKQALCHSINSLIKTKETILNIPAFLNSIFKIENGKYNAADHEKRSQEFKRATLPVGINLHIKSI